MNVLKKFKHWEHLHLETKTGKTDFRNEKLPFPNLMFPHI